MLPVWVRISALAFVAAGAAGCVSEQSVYGDLPDNAGPETAREIPGPDQPQKPLECVPYARAHSGVKLYGDAWTWWEKAAGKFSRGFTPRAGAVLVLAGYAGPQRGHVAVVRSQISTREIHVDHANWLGDGSIYLDDPVADVSENNDWSQVRVWNIKTGGWGSRIYPVQGFIGPGDDSVPDRREAPDDNSDPARIARADLGITQ